MEQILIVEDDTDINNMVASALTKAGYRNNHVDPDGKFKWAYDAEERYMRKEVKRWRLRVSFW